MTELEPAAVASPSSQSAQKNRHLPDEIARGLQAQIAAGDLGVGDRLPSERELCSMYSVSRAVVREALSQLKSEGLVAARAGSGVYVTQQDATNAFRLQSFSLLDDTALAQAMELLITVETAATRIAARHRTEEDLKSIKRALIGMEYAVANDMLGDEEDYRFHQAIVEATHNPNFISLSKHLEASARSVIRRARINTRTNRPDLLEAVQDEHKKIFQAIELGDEAAASLAAEQHLSNAAARIQIYTASEKGT